MGPILHNIPTHQSNRNAKRVLLYWDRLIYMPKTVANNRPDINVKDKRQKYVYFVDIAVPNNNYLINMVCHRIEKSVDLRMEIERKWNVQTKVIPIVVSSTGVVPQNTVNAVNELGGGIGEIRAMQKAALLHTANTVRTFVRDHRMYT